MTSTVIAPPVADSPDGDDRDAIDAIEQRLLTEQARFLPIINGQEVYSPYALAMLVNEIATKRATDTVRTLTGELREAGDDVHYLVNLLVASDERAERLAVENAQLRDELHGREPVT